MSTKYYVEMKDNVNKLDWKKEMNMDLVATPKVLAPEPYCSGKRGAVIGRCDYIKRGCDSSTFPVDQCLCNKDTGNIEKCSKYFFFLNYFFYEFARLLFHHGI